MNTRPPRFRAAAGLLLQLAAAGAGWLSLGCDGTEPPRENVARRRSSQAREPDVAPSPSGSRDAMAEPASEAGSAEPPPSDAGGGVDAEATLDGSASSSDASAADAGPGGGAPELDLGAACGERPVLEGQFSRERLRTAAADCSIWQFCAFREAARALETAVEVYVEQPDDTSLSRAREAWLRAMEIWSVAESFQFGPASSVAMSAGKDTYQGKGLRDRIYAWPVTARCRVEEQVLAGRTQLDGALISGRGLFALEYLLFYPGSDIACADASPTARDWSELDSNELAARKRAYAAAVARDIRLQAETLHDAWIPGGGDFKGVFVSASGYPDEQTALNVLAWALVYVEKEVKDWKLGIPAGYTITAPVSGPEAPFAHVGAENIRANLRGFRALFQGCGVDGRGLGFDDWLEAAGHGELARTMLAALDGAERAVAELGPLHTASPAQLEAAYQAVRELTSLMKGDLFGTGSPLNLKLPTSVEGDTD